MVVLPELHQEALLFYPIPSLPSKLNCGCVPPRKTVKRHVCGCHYVRATYCQGKMAFASGGEHLSHIRQR